MPFAPLGSLSGCCGLSLASHLMSGGASAQAAKPATPAAPRLPQKGEEARLFAAQVGARRNDPCPCGSGVKFKKCCYDKNWTPPASPDSDADSSPASV